jgi:ribosomal protein S14
MLHSKVKDLKHRKQFYKIEKTQMIDNFVFRNLVANPKLSKSLKKNIFFKFYNTKKSRVKNRIVRRCVLTNRGRGNLQAFKISRTLLRELMGFGIIPGYKKSVW